MKTKTGVKTKIRKTRGFTLGLALIIVATTLLISISMSTLLMRDLKNSSSNTRSSTVYNVAESALECVSSYEESIKYFDATGQARHGVFPTSTSYNSNNSWYVNAVPNIFDSFVATPGYAFKNYDVNNEGSNNKYFPAGQIKCFGVEILNNLGTSLNTNTTLSFTGNTAPIGYYSASGNTGVVTEINLDKDDLQIKDQNGNNMDVCVNVKVYSVPNFNSAGDTIISHKRLIQSEALTPCSGTHKVKRLLVKYFD